MEIIKNILECSCYLTLIALCFALMYAIISGIITTINKDMKRRTERLQLIEENVKLKREIELLKNVDKKNK